MAKSIKIIFTGLDFGGKTSILRTLQQKKYALEDLKPTVGIDRLSINVLDCCINEWDLGGQEKYRKEYLEQEKPFYETDLLYYVIDAADIERYSESLAYYKSIIEILFKQKLKPAIIILLNKVDKEDDIIAEKLQNLQNTMLDLSKGYDIRFFRTSIYESQTLLRAFSHGITKISKKTGELSSQLRGMAEETFADAILLVESNGFVLGEYAKDDDSRQMVTAVYNYLIGAFSYMYRVMSESDKPERILIDWEDKGYAFLGSTQIEEFEFFFIKYSSNPRKIVQKFVLRSLIKSSKQVRAVVKSFFD